MNTATSTTPACHGECPSGAAEETKLVCGDAKDVHGICVRHGTMSTNGELRFRLNSLKDGSAYIRTQTTGDSQGWQKPHFHKRLKETYVVEKGWIGYVELAEGAPVYKKVGSGEVFTTSPEVVHNIYMSADSVIHTVKHNGSAPDASGKSDWWSDDRCIRLAKLVGQGFPDDVRRAAPPADQPPTDPEKTYNAAYRHFDTLIWQVPAWSSALFAAIVASVNSFLTPSSPSPGNAPPPAQPSNAIAALLHLSTDDFAAVQITLFGVFTLVLGYALYRFRWHQIGTRTWSRTPSSPKVSPQTLLQLVVNIESAALLFVAGALWGLPRSAVGVALLLTIGYLSYRGEQLLRMRTKAHNPSKMRQTDVKEDEPVSGAS